MNYSEGFASKGPEGALKDLAFLFLRLGTVAFGGPAAHLAMMEDEIVHRRHWLTRDQFLDLIGAANLIPGPNSTEVAIHVGYIRAGWAGLLVAGGCFILRWIQRYVPEFEKKWNRYARPVSTSWRVDETYIEVRGKGKYLYRAVDKQGNTVDFLLSQHRDVGAAKQFFTQAIEKHTAPEKITLDGYAATHTAVRELKESVNLPINICVRTSKYLNNLIEQDHRRVKQRVYPMLGFKRFENAAVTISGIELVHKIKKVQFDTTSLALSKERAPQIWEAVMAA